VRFGARYSMCGERQIRRPLSRRVVRRPHSRMLRIWFIFIFGSFAVSILTLTYVQTRIWKKRGWSVLRERPLSETYWTHLSPVERVLLWLGFVALFITLVSASGWKVITLFGQRVSDPWAQTSNPPLEPIVRLLGNAPILRNGSTASR
jgi:hypothetical protein